MDKREKWLHTMNVYDEYEKRFARARIDRPFRMAAEESVRKTIIEEAKQILKYDEKLIPQIHDMTQMACEEFETYSVTQLRYQTWEHFYVSASLYEPYAQGPHPLVFLFCGHGAQGRLTPGYVYMAHRLAKLGFAVMVPDNIGQGDRIMQGHVDCVAPFYSGLSLQGMIVMESVALIRYMQKDSRFDPARFGSCGNSGGGVLNLFLAALAPELSALSSSGFPSEFHYIFEKEKRHCCCSLLPGIMKGPEMWEILSVFAPKPLLVEQGEQDFFFPNEYARRNARKVKNVYVQLGAEENFMLAITQTAHSWECVDREVISRFLCQALNVEFVAVENDVDTTLLAQIESWKVDIPEDSYDTARVAASLTGVTMPKGTELSDIYPPVYKGRKIIASELLEETERGNTMRVLAQMECSL